MKPKNHHNYKRDFIHHQTSSLEEVLKELVFGMEDGMVSTLGSITGIAVGSGDHFTVLLAGFVIVAVESISMGIGSYLSNNSQEKMEQRKLWEEETEIRDNPEEERQELYDMYLREGWPEQLAEKMSDTAYDYPDIMLKEMALRELKVFPSKNSSALKGGLCMFGAYVVGGAIPMFSYFLLPFKLAIPISIVVTLTGLFVLGVITANFTKQFYIKSGLKMLIFGGIALIVGLAAGNLAN